MRKFLIFLTLSGFIGILLNPLNISGSDRQPRPISKSSSEGTTDGPKVYFSETSWNFGKIPLNSGVSHVFWAKNVGTDTLKILKVRPG